MSFVQMRNQLIEHFNAMTKNVNYLFEVEVDKDELWNLYLDSFTSGTNEIFRVRRKHDCSCCRHFIKTFGNVVTIENNIVTTIWDFKSDDTIYQPVLDALSAYIKSHNVSNVYFSNTKEIGVLNNYEELENGQIHEWSHFFVEVPSKFVNKIGRSIGDIKGEYRDTKNVFYRSLEEISLEAIDVVLELIRSNSLYRGAEWLSALEKFRKYKEQYMKLPLAEKELYVWEQSIQAGMVIGRIKNHSIGTLLINITNEMDLDTAVKKYEEIVAPANYKRSKPIYSKRMLEDAKNKITELGYLDSLNRRFAILDDININNILFSNKDANKRIVGGNNIFDEMEKDISNKPKKFSKIEEISIDSFISNILPTVTEIELYFENNLTSNMVSLITANNPESKTMFKWNNNFSWAYTGNITDSMKERVKQFGGKIDGDLRFSIQWNEDGKDNCDLDAHCIEPSKYEICYYSARKPNMSPTKGQLDVDIIRPDGKIAVENITWANRQTMQEGTYLFFVEQYTGSTKNGFRAEIEFDGQVYSFNYNKPTKYKERIQVAEVTLNKDKTFTIKELIPSSMSSKEIWGLKTNEFIPVSVICYSPNWWDNQSGIGHKHVFFMLKDCINNESPNGFYNEFLNNELYEHRKVMEALGSKLHVVNSDDQLSGVGFSTTKRNEVVLKIKGSTERIIKVKF